MNDFLGLELIGVVYGLCYLMYAFWHRPPEPLATELIQLTLIAVT